MRRIFRISAAGAAMHSVAAGLRRRRFLLPSWNFDLLQDALDDLLGGEVLRLGLVRERDAVAEDVVRDGLHVFGRDEATVSQEGVRPRGEVQVDGRARRGAILDVAGEIRKA